MIMSGSLLLKSELISINIIYWLHNIVTLSVGKSGLGVEDSRVRVLSSNISLESLAPGILESLRIKLNY